VFDGNLQMYFVVHIYNLTCLVSKSSFVRLVAYGLAAMLFCCDYFNWRSDEFLQGNADLCYDFFVE